MQKLITFVSLIFFLSCTQKDSRDLNLFNKVSYQMQAGEAISIVSPKVSDLYKLYFNNQSIQVPLYKYIEHSKYVVFVGIPYNTSIGDLIKTKKESADCNELFFESDSASFFKKYYKDGLYVCEYATIVDKGTIYLASTTKHKEVADSLFSRLKMSNRIKFTRSKNE